VKRQFTIPGSPEAIPEARQKILDFLEQQGCPEESAFEVGMAVQEALANAVVHGCNSDPGRMVRVAVTSDASGVSIVIHDPGPGFDPGQVRDVTSSEGRVAHGGRGIPMMKAYMDEVSYSDGGREVRMRKNCVQRNAQTA
jgi:serine/threonine-protein kinase RsbW